MKSYLASQNVFDIFLCVSGVTLFLGAFFIFRSAEFKELLYFVKDHLFQNNILKNKRSMTIPAAICTAEEEWSVAYFNEAAKQTVNQSYVSVKIINQRKIDFNPFDKIKAQIESVGNSLQENLQYQKYPILCA